MFYLETQEKNDCYGCRACEQICPLGCIEMSEDKEGFCFPIIIRRDICTHCNLCKGVCPNANKDKILNGDSNFQPKAYMVIHKDDNILDKSSSGGAFTAIVNAFYKDNSVIFGVELDKNLNAIHTYTETIQGTEKYRRSKYIQSDINNCYKKAESFLLCGKRVLFTGTPCQIAGLKLYLGKEYNNLICVDILCRGVPSQKVFNEYKDYLQKKYKGKVTSYTFRYRYKKRTGIVSKQINSRNIRAVIDNKTIVLNSDTDLYLRGFYQSLFYRRSCYKCKYADAKRVSDITIGDFWAVEKLYPNENPHKGVSCVLTNTKKGQRLVEEISMCKVTEVNRDFVVENTSMLTKPTGLHQKRDEFFVILNITHNFNKAISSCTLPVIASKVFRIASRVLSDRSKILLKKLIKRSGKNGSFSGVSKEI